MCRGNREQLKKYINKLRETAMKEEIGTEKLWAKLSYTLFVMSQGKDSLNDDEMLGNFETFYRQHIEQDNEEYFKNGVNNIFNYYIVIGAM